MVGQDRYSSFRLEENEIHGAVLASRLSEDPTRAVLLLEAGTAYGVDEVISHGAIGR